MLRVARAKAVERSSRRTANEWVKGHRANGGHQIRRGSMVRDMMGAARVSAQGARAGRRIRRVAAGAWIYGRHGTDASPRWPARRYFEAA